MKTFVDMILEQDLKKNFFVLSIMGIIGNTLSIVIYGRKSMVKLFINKLYLVLSTIDLLVLVHLIVESSSILFYGVNLNSINAFSCKILTFLGYSLVHSRNLFSAAILVKQACLISVKKHESSNVTPGKTIYSMSNSLTQSVINRDYSLRRTNTHTQNNSITTKSNIKFNHFKFHFVLSCTLILPTVLNFHFLLFFDLNLKLNPQIKTFHVIANQSMLINQFNASLFSFNQNEQTIRYLCSPIPSDAYEYFSINYWYWLDILVTLAMPCAIKNVAFIYIFYYLKKLNRKYAHFLSNQEFKANHRIYYLRIKKNRSILLKVFVTNFYFILSVMPIYLLQFVEKIENIDVNLLKGILVILFYSNNVLSIFFNGFFSARFRKEFVRFFKCSHS